MADKLTSEMADLMEATLEAYPDRGKIIDLAPTVTEYTFKGFVEGDRAKTYEGGTSIRREVNTDFNENTEAIGHYSVATLDRSDSLTYIDVPRKIIRTSAHWDAVEVDTNKGSSVQLVNLVDNEMRKMDVGWAEQMETWMWGAAPTSTTTKQIYGIKYWIVQDSSDGYNGGNPSGWSTTGGLDADSYTRWNNYTNTYSAYTNADMVGKVIKARYKTNWKSVPYAKDMLAGNTPRYHCYTDLTVMTELGKLCRAQNENMGSELAMYEGKPIIMSAPFSYVPKLDDDDNQPIYMIDHGSFEFTVLKNWFKKRTKPKAREDMPLVIVMYEHTVCNLLCVGRDRNAVLYKA